MIRAIFTFVKTSINQTKAAAARALAPHVRFFRRGLRLAFFSVEEWALTGSAQYVDSLSTAERQRIALNVNLDSVGGSPNLAALTSGFAQLEPFLLRLAEASGIPLRTVRPLMQNSDHANFALGGIPALFVTGKEIVIPAGADIYAKVRSDTSLHAILGVQPVQEAPAAIEVDRDTDNEPHAEATEINNDEHPEH